MNPYLEPRKTPFSCRGSYLVFSRYDDLPDGTPDLALRTVSQMAEDGTICRIALLVDGRPVKYDIEMEPAELRLVSAAGTLRVCFGDAETVLFRAAGPRLGLRFDFTLTKFISTFGSDLPAEGRALRIFTCRQNLCRMLLDVRAGSRADDQDWNGHGSSHTSSTVLPDASGSLFATLREIRTQWDGVVPAWDYEEALALRRADFRAFLGPLPPAPAGLEDSRELAAYILWSCCVRPFNALRREAMLMSKNWMTNVWSWDHCFNAVALAGAHPDIAWDQFMLLFDFQDATGALPDSVSDLGGVYTFCKPPVHGWALGRMMRRMSLSKARIQEAYDKLARWTGWWLQFRDRDRNGLCEYDHGNDSGWDNSTPFQFLPPVETPDLQAFLVLQMETLADLAGRLGRTLEAEFWLARSRALLERMCELCFDADGLPLARKAYTGETASPDSLLLYLPVLLGKRLPGRIRARLVAELKSDRFLTEWGFATESPKSPFYKPDGYWLGPVWAPATQLVVDGLHACGEEEFARDVENRFLRLFAKGGSGENFDALTGLANNDPAYTWASAVFLTLLGDR